jgi:translation initiation factor 1
VESFLAPLTSELKKKCGSGGTFSLADEHGKIEIQGDKRELIRKILLGKGIKAKG